MSDKVKVEVAGSVNPGGVRWFLVAFALCGSAFSLSNICEQLKDANDLKRQEVDIQRARLDVANRQYALDSLAFYGNQKNR